MSVFGGDSWRREAQYRKRRVDDLLLEAAGDHSASSSYRKLPSGKYACLVCPHNPVLDTSLMLSMHMKASRHCAAEGRLKQREQEKQNELNKRIAVSRDSTLMVKTGSTSTKESSLAKKPLVEQTRKAAFEVLQSSSLKRSTANNAKDVEFSWDKSMNVPSNSSTRASDQMDASCKDFVLLPLDYRQRKERELKFTAAGWKRDCHGGWFRDENVEFDSDEEDPNVSLACGE